MSFESGGKVWRNVTCTHVFGSHRPVEFDKITKNAIQLYNAVEYRTHKIQ